MVRHAEGAAPVNSLPRDEMSVSVCGVDEADPASEVVSSVDAVDSAVDSEEEEPASSEEAEADTEDELSSFGWEELEDEEMGDELSSSGWDEEDDAEMEEPLSPSGWDELTSDDELEADDGERVVGEE